MAISTGQRMFHRADPLTLGTVIGKERGESRVRWDDGPARGSWYDDVELWNAHGPRRPNPPMLDAPLIQDLEFGTRLDPRTGSLHIVRDSSYRGDGAEMPELGSSSDAYDLVSGMGLLPQEHIIVLLVNGDMRVIGWKPTHKGHLDSVEASLRQIFTDAVLSGDAVEGIVLFHNHPSGDPGASPDDENLTRAVERVGQRLRINLIDHIIVGRPASNHARYYSFRDEGKLSDEVMAPVPNLEAPPPPPIEAASISDLELLIDNDPESGSLQPIRDGDYRGDAPEKPVIENADDVAALFPAIGDDASLAIFLDTRQQIVGWSAWGDARGENAERLIRRAIVPPMILNARSVVLLRRTGVAEPTKHDDELTEELTSIGGDLDIELFDHILVGDDGIYSYQEAGRLARGDG